MESLPIWTSTISRYLDIWGSNDNLRYFCGWLSSISPVGYFDIISSWFSFFLWLSLPQYHQVGSFVQFSSYWNFPFILWQYFQICIPRPWIENTFRRVPSCNNSDKLSPLSKETSQTIHDLYKIGIIFVVATNNNLKCGQIDT